MTTGSIEKKLIRWIKLNTTRFDVDRALSGEAQYHHIERISQTLSHPPISNSPEKGNLDNDGRAEGSIEKTQLRRYVMALSFYSICLLDVQTWRAHTKHIKDQCLPLVCLSPTDRAHRSQPRSNTALLDSGIWIKRPRQLAKILYMRRQAT